MRLGLVALLLLGAAQAPLPLPPPPPPPAAATPPGSDVTPSGPAVTPRPAPADMLARYRADERFQYDRPEAERPSLATLLWQWIQRHLIEPAVRGLGERGVVWLLIGLAVGLLGWGVSRLLRAEGGGGLFARRDRALGSAGPLLDVDDLATVDVAALLARALAEGRLREAVRYRFLVLLQALDRAGVVAWRRDKTNRDYATEARRHGDVGTAFAEAARAFDYVWYGERPVDADRYARLDPLFARAERAGR